MTKIKLYETTADLKRFCEAAQSCRFVAIDTEFIRDKTYYPKLCLLQMAVSFGPRDEVALFDPLSPKLDLHPLAGLLDDADTVKVLHAARQDLELFYLEFGVLPKPVFDTQIAAQVCGYGEQVSYEGLVSDIKKVTLDKSSQITDWARRPLSDRQLRYAASDVDHLRDIYVDLAERLRRSGRKNWIEEETAQLTDPSTYQADPKDAWLRIKRRKGPPLFQAALCELAKFREQSAQKRNLPRQWILRDEALLELAHCLPSNPDELARLRFVGKSKVSERISRGIFMAVSRARQRASSKEFESEKRAVRRVKSDTELLRALLKIKAKQLGVAERLIATADDLQEIASGNPCARPLNGWRRDVFGDDAVRLCRGQVALTCENGNPRIIAVPAPSL